MLRLPARRSAVMARYGAIAPADSLQALYEQYKECSSPSQVPEDVLIAIDRLLREKQQDRKRDNKRVLAVIVTLLVLLIAIALTGGRGLRKERFSLHKRSCAAPVHAAPSGAEGLQPVATQSAASAAKAPDDDAAAACSAPLTRGANGCDINYDAKYITCGPYDSTVAHFCSPGISSVAGTTPHPFTAQCVQTDPPACAWACEAGYSLTNGNTCAVSTPPPAPPSAPAAAAPTSPPIPTSSSMISSSSVATSSSAAKETASQTSAVVGACTVDKDCDSSTFAGQDPLTMATPTCVAGASAKTCGFACASPTAIDKSAGIVYTCSVLAAANVTVAPASCTNSDYAFVTTSNKVTCTSSALAKGQAAANEAKNNATLSGASKNNATRS